MGASISPFAALTAFISDPERAAAKLEKVLEAKWRTLRDDPQGRLKLIRFALSRGYDYEPVRPLIERITAPR